MIAGVVVLGIGNVLYLRASRRASTPLGSPRPPVHYVLAGLIVGGALLGAGLLVSNFGA